MKIFLHICLIVIFSTNLALSNEYTATAQRLLNSIGYNAGPVDGLMGKKTRSAMTNAMMTAGKKWSGTFSQSDIDILSRIEKSIYTEKKDIPSLIPLKELRQIVNSNKEFKLINEAAFFEHRLFVINTGFPGDDDWEFCLKDFAVARLWIEDIGQDTGQKFEDKMRQLNCTQTFLTAPDISPKHMEEFSNILVNWATNTDNVWTLPKKNIGSNHWYSALSFFGNLGQWYPFYEKKLLISTEEREIVRDYIKDYLLQASFEGGLNGGKRSCPNDPLGILSSNVDTNWCGSVRWKVATGKLSFGMYLEDAELMNAGINDLKIVLKAYDSDAYFIPYSPTKKQAHGFNYYYQQARFLSVLVELFATRGFDFLHYELPNGGTVKRAIDFTYEVSMNDFKKLGKYPATGVSDRLPKASWERVINFSHQEFIVDNESYHGAYDINTPRIQFASINPRYSQNYKPADFALSFTYKEQVSSFSAILARSIFAGNNQQSIKTLSQQALDEVKSEELASVIYRKLNCLGPLGMSGGDKYEDGYAIMEYCLTKSSNNADRFQFSVANGWTVKQPGSLRHNRFFLFEKVEPKNKSSSTKYRFRIVISDENSNKFWASKATIFASSWADRLGMDIDKLTDAGTIDEKEFKLVAKECDYENFDDFPYFELAMVTRDVEEIERTECYIKNSEGTSVENLVAFYIALGQELRAQIN